MNGTHTVELTDTHREAEALSHKALDLAAGGRCVVLAVIEHKSEHLPAQFNRVAVASVDQCLFTFTLDATRAADTRSYDASERSSASAPLRQLPLARPAEQSPAWLLGVFGVSVLADVGLVFLM